MPMTRRCRSRLRALLDNGNAPAIGLARHWRNLVSEGPSAQQSGRPLGWTSWRPELKRQSTQLVNGEMLGSIPASHPHNLEPTIMIRDGKTADNTPRSADRPQPSVNGQVRPVALPVLSENIPEDLKRLACWLVWKYVKEVDPETGEVDWDKPPSNARTGGLASSTNPKTWSPFAVALDGYRRGGWDGIGLALHRSKDADGPGLVGVDLDKCRDPDTGVLDPWAQQVVEALQSYTEARPSGRGVRIFVLGRLPPAGRKKGPFEVYETGRYVTVTGQHIAGTPPSVETRQAELEAVHRQFFGEAARKDTKAPRTAATLSLTDAELIQKACEANGNGDKFRRLWEGDASGYGSRSEADAALVNYLCFWTAGDLPRVVDLFAQSGLARSKWNRPDYQRRTFDLAMKGRTEFYDPARNHYPGNAEPGRNGQKETGPPSPWPDPIPLGGRDPVPEFPLDVLPDWLGIWVRETAEATQTPPDLSAMLALAICAAGLAGKFRVEVRPGWGEPLNIYNVVALPPGERKSAVFARALAPVVAQEQAARQAMAALIAEAASEHRILEQSLRRAEQRAAQTAAAADRQRLQTEARGLAAQLAQHDVPEPPRLFADDTTPEKLCSLLAAQGGR